MARPMALLASGVALARATVGWVLFFFLFVGGSGVAVTSVSGLAVVARA